MEEAAAGQQIAALVARFQALPARQRRQMNEAQVCRSFIDPLFEALGWNVRDPDEVLFEHNTVGQRADYVFRIGGVSRFIVEAKAPHRDLTNDEFKRQAVTYAYNKGVNWAVLTNFDRLLVFSAEEGQQFLSLSTADYLSAFDDLWLLSRQAVESGAFDEKVRRYGALHLSQPVETSLFDQLRQWRADLFTQIDRYNSGLMTAQVDEYIQQLLNRLIFIRTAEDRHIEEHRLRAILNQWRGNRQGYLIERLRSVFADFERSYDSELFPPPLGDPWASLFVDNDILEPILNGLYNRPRSSAGYDFAAIDADVLGAVYEQYLGYVAVASQQRQASAQARLMGLDDSTFVLEAKRERRKAQGIYYTPRWVVDYIVRQTVGRFIEEHTYDEVLNMTILDPACGSGSFLIRAYEELLRYHARTRNKTVAELDPFERLSILTRNIFGVDLDDQAVRIARLNLLLRGLAKRETLPLLKENIRRGNSLISGDEIELRPYFGDAWRDKHPFDWEHEFPATMARGGFDVVIGNPPYVRPHKLDTSIKRYLWKHFSTYRAKSDIYHCFIEQALALTRIGGMVSFITGDNWRVLQSAEPLRSLVLRRSRILQLATLPAQVFQEAAVQTLIFALQKIDHGEFPVDHLVQVVQLPDGVQRRYIPQKFFSGRPGVILDLTFAEGIDLRDKIEQRGEALCHLVTIDFGLKTGHDAAFIRSTPTRPEDRRLVRGGGVARYSLHWAHEYVWYVPQEMRLHRQTARPGERERFECPKILIRDTSFTIMATYDEDNFYAKDVLILHRPQHPYSLKYLLAILNSTLMAFYYNSRYTSIHVNRNETLNLPIRRIDPSDADDVAMHDRLVALVERMLDLNRRLTAKGKLRDAEAEDLERDIARTDREIDDLVYDLYGLTADERRLVEDAVGR